MMVADSEGGASVREAIETRQTSHRAAEFQVVDRHSDMKMLLGLVLLSFLVSPVLSLDCYVCSSAATNEECNSNNSTQTCQLPLDMCMTVIDILGAVKKIHKSCSSKATCTGAAATAALDSDGNGNIVNCCNTYSLCNFSGAESVHTHTALLLTVGVLLLLSH